MTVSDVDNALTEIREILQLDGADLVVTSVADGRAELALVLDNASCKECVLPRQAIEDIVLDQLHKSLPSITTAVIDDPRE